LDGIGPKPSSIKDAWRAEGHPQHHVFLHSQASAPAAQCGSTKTYGENASRLSGQSVCVQGHSWHRFKTADQIAQKWHPFDSLVRACAGLVMFSWKRPERTLRLATGVSEGRNGKLLLVDEKSPRRHWSKPWPGRFMKEEIDGEELVSCHRSAERRRISPPGSKTSVPVLPIFID